MKKKIKSKLGAIAIAVILTFVSVGCHAVNEEPEGAGPAAGAAAIAPGAEVVAGVMAPEALVEGLFGILSGGVIGDYVIDQKRPAVESFSLYHYQPTMGTLVKIESHTVEPYTVGSGGSVDIMTTYVVMAPDAALPVKVTESHEIWYDKKRVGNTLLEMNFPSGTYGSSVPLLLPVKTQAGTYQVITTISTAAGSDSRQTTFVVM